MQGSSWFPSLSSQSGGQQTMRPYDLEPAPAWAEALREQLEALEWQMNGRFMEVERQLLELRGSLGARQSSSWFPAWGDGVKGYDNANEYVTRESSRASTFLAMPAPDDDGEGDDAHEYVAQETTWDLCLFVGLEAVGFELSFSFFLLLILAIAVQVTFLIVIILYMLDDPVCDQMLTSLLLFRTSVAHDIRYADMVSHESLARQVCDQAFQTPAAAQQMQFIGDLMGSAQAGYALTLVALGCWILSLQEEFEVLSRFTNALYHLPRKWSTEYSMTVDPMTGEVAGTYLAVSHCRVLMTTVLMIVPRFIILVLLLVVGSVYIIQTLNLSDLLLNALALGLVKDTDELIFAALMSHRGKHLVATTKPLPVPRTRMHRVCDSTLSKLLTLGLVLSAVSFIFLDGFQERLLQAQSLLCSGNLDFVYVENPVTGVVTAATSMPGYISPRGLATQKSVLQLARPVLRESQRQSWSMGSQVSSAENFRYHLSELLPDEVRFFNGSFDWRSFNEVHQMQASNVKDHAEHMICEDSTKLEDSDDGKKLWAHTQISTASEGRFTSCQGVEKLCAMENMTQIRGLCPETCGCAAITDAPAGFFAAPAFGCPTSCDRKRQSAMAYAMVTGHAYPCADLPAASWSHNLGALQYIKSFVDHMRSNPSLMLVLRMRATKAFEAHLKLPQSKGLDVVEYMTKVSGIVVNIEKGLWQLAPGVPHPRGFKGCEFWTSYEVSELLSTDFCEDSVHSSMRMLCPVSCECRSEKKGCPLSCALHFAPAR